MIQLHWGEPKLPTSLSAYTGAILSKEDGKDDLRFTNHRIAKWYGVSFGLRFFLGVWRFGETKCMSHYGDHRLEH